MTRAAVVLAGAAKPGGAAPKSRGMLLQRQCACGADVGAGAVCRECEPLQRRGTGVSQDDGVPRSVQDTLRSPGQPLDSHTRALMEQRFDYSFANVRVHTNAEAANSARAVNARAYTVGSSVVFDSGCYAPHSTIGQRLIAHELAHVVQQTRGGSASGESTLEHAANRAADAALYGTKIVIVAGTSAPRLARAPGDQTPQEVAQALVKQLKAQGKPIVVNIGGTGAAHEPAHAINVNPNREGVGRTDIPNFVKAKGEAIGTLFKAGQVEGVVGFGLSPPIFDWEKIANGANVVLKPGGKIEIAFRWPDSKSAQQLVDALKKAGFENVTNMSDAVISATKGSGGPKPVGPIVPGRGGGGPGTGTGDAAAKGTQAALRAGVEEAGSIAARPPVVSPKMIIEMEKSLNALRAEAAASARLAGYVRTGVAVFNSALQAFVVVTTMQDAKEFAHKGTIFGDAQDHAEKLRKNAAEILQISETQWDNISLLALTIIEEELERASDHEKLDDLGRTLGQFAAALDDQLQSLPWLVKNLRARGDAARAISRQMLKFAEVPQGLGTIPQAQEFMLSESLSALSGPLLSAADDYEQAHAYLLHLKLGLEAVGKKADRAYARIIMQKVNDAQIKSPEAAAKEMAVREAEIDRPAVIADPQKRDDQQKEIISRLQQQAQKKPSPAKKDKPATTTPAGPPALLPQQAPEPPGLLPGALGPGPVQLAAQEVAAAQSWTKSLYSRSVTLRNLTGTSNAPSKTEREAMLAELETWRLAMKAKMNDFTAKGRSEAANALGALIDEYGPKFAEIRSQLGG